MKNSYLDDMNCSLANALELIGERWTLLILREAFYGSCRFEDFQQHLGIARNILTARLSKLCDSGVLQRVPVKEGAKRHEYRLTPMGRDLFPALIALNQWGDRWLHDAGAPVQFVEHATGQEISAVSIQAEDGRKLDARDLIILPGPGANTKTKVRLRLLQLAWEKHNRDK
ncbi:MAG: helix-turn-helix transcriptional regulator [Gammaproteobacteria bacterium]|nr:helix-turn-helix transcriptional regulator [Gammaproteobacteria bacterium]